MFYFYLILFFTSSILLEIQYLRKKISNEYIILFLISLAYRNIIIFHDIYFLDKDLVFQNPIMFFINFFFLVMIFYISIFYFLFFSIQDFRTMNYLYFIEH